MKLVRISGAYAENKNVEVNKVIHSLFGAMLKSLHEMMLLKQQLTEPLSQLTPSWFIVSALRSCCDDRDVQQPSPLVPPEYLAVRPWARS